MRLWVFCLALLLLAAPALASHNDGKGPRSLGGTTVEPGPLLLTLETDAFPEKPLGVLENDPDATGGTAWNLTDYGMISTTIDIPTSGVVWFDIRARGWHPAEMRNPHMHILVDGVQRAEWDVRGTWMTYPQAVPILAGKHTISIDNFDNYRGATKARTLVVDWLKMTTPTLDGSPVVRAGSSVLVDAAEIHNSVTGQLERNASARNGTEWRQWGIGCFSEMFVFEAEGAHELRARMRGSVHGGVGSNVLVQIDGRKIDQYFSMEARADHVTKFETTRGAHMIEICYDNDLPGEKRELWLDEMEVTSLDAAPAPAAPWTSAHATLSGHRHVPSDVRVGNIQTAREAWTYTSGAVTGTPAVAEGVLYFGDMGGTVHAVRASDGTKVWTVAHGAGVDSSLALDENNVYIGDAKGWLSARARSDGSLVWRVRADPVEGTHLYGSPVLHEGVLYTGVASEQTLIEYEGAQTFRGSVAAFDTKDGKMLWKTYTQSEDGKGVSVWSTPAIDVDLGYLFVGTGNSYGEPVSKYTDSMLALRLSDGTIMWSHQATANDGFDGRGAPGPDRDFGSSPLLFEANGRKLVGEGDKGGNFFALDRATGEVVWTAKANFKVEGVPAARLEGFLGSPTYADGRIYAPTTARSMVNAIDATTGKILWETELNPLPAKYGDRMFGSSTVAEGVVLQGNAFGRVFALDARTGEILLNLSANGGVQGGISVSGDRFYVPNVGKDLWSGKGGVTAFVVDRSIGGEVVPTTPTGTVPPTSSGTPTPTGTPTPEPTAQPGPGGEVEESAGILQGIPGPGPLGVLTAVGVAMIAGMIRRRRQG